MARRKAKTKFRDILPDWKYNSITIAKFVNIMMRGGKKSTAESIIYEALDIIKEKLNKDPKEVFEKAIENIKPVVEVRSRRVGGANYQVPVEVSQTRRRTLAFRWLKQYTNQRNEKGLPMKLASELIDAYNNTGNTIKKKMDVYKMAEANKAFSHYRW